MSTKLRFGKVGQSLLATLLACGAIACTSTEASSNGGAGGSAGSSNGGASAGAGGNVGGAAGSTTAATGTLCPLPSQALIADFTYTPSDAGTTSTSQPRFAAGTLTGGGSSYPTTLTSDVTQGNWHFTGTISDYSGFALYFDNCDILDASKYKGISFTISGTATGNLTMGVGTVADKASAAWLISKGDTQSKATDSGTCTPTSGDNRYYTPGCESPITSFAIPATATTKSFLWSDFTGGKPVTSPNPKEITTVYWYFSWAGTGSTSYPVDVTIDDLKFVE